MRLSLLCLLAGALLQGSAVHADTLQLADGSLLEGSFVGSSNGIIMFDTGAGIEAFPESKVVGLYFSAGVATAEAMQPEAVTVPAGTQMVLRTVDTVDSRRHGAGHRFRAQVEGAIVVGGTTVIPRGAYVHGRVIQANQAGRVAGT